MSLQLYSERQEALLYLQLIFKLGKVVTSDTPKIF
jgi:hypothetical protein